MQSYTVYQLKQIEVINSLEQQVKNKSMGFSTVAPVNNYASDTRRCLTSVHLPHQELITQVQDQLIKPLQKISPDYFFYPEDSLHITIKNVRVINDPPHFTQEDIGEAERVFEIVLPKHKKFNVYFYRLLLFPNNLALIGTTDPEMGSIFLDLDRELKAAGVLDDKKYINSQYFFCNMTLTRFNKAPGKKFLQKIEDLSQSISFEPYVVDSVTLVTSTAVFTKKKIIKTWELAI